MSAALSRFGVPPGASTRARKAAQHAVRAVRRSTCGVAGAYQYDLLGAGQRALVVVAEALGITRSCEGPRTGQAAAATTTRGCRRRGRRALEVDRPRGAESPAARRQER
jgi:hypothetical protein